MRGALSKEKDPLKAEWIIPADAGSTFDAGRVPVSSEDHPRGCGEHFMALYRSIWFEGSSPRMRGARSTLLSFSRRARIIPADAGSTG